MKILLSDALAQLDPSVLPAVQNLQVPWINRCLETFFGEGKWARTTIKWKGLSTSAMFAIQRDNCGNAFFTLPRGMLSLLAGAYGQTGQQPRPNYRVQFSTAEIQGQWHRYGNSGGAVSDEYWGRGILDMGDGFTCFADILEPSYLQVITETTETNATNVLFRGRDPNGNEIFSGSGPGTTIGVTLNIGASTTTQTTQQFGSAPYTIQKPVTNGPIYLYAVSAATGISTLISQFDPGDTAPGFRRYQLGGTGRGFQPYNNTPIPYATVHAIVKRRFVPVVANSDEIIPSSIVALESGLQGRRYDLQGDSKTADEYWAEAIHRLNSELTEYNGAATPQVIFQRDTGLARIPSI
ncbi:MAG: hypothetical protein WBD81_17870 [Collimonas pratensis]|uniref:hypothetical protein n=1 Tax=Collimonas pratensis TaxID=279113 RepID=UPI003C7581BC